LNGWTRARRAGIKMALCEKCGRYFDDGGDRWKYLCVICWKRKKSHEPGDGGVSTYWRNRALSVENRLMQIEHRHTPHLDELREHLQTLIFFCHPDRNGGDPRATELTKWLLTMREVLST
jgi:hypothetical protein